MGQASTTRRGSGADPRRFTPGATAPRWTTGSASSLLRERCTWRAAGAMRTSAATASVASCLRASASIRSTMARHSRTRRWPPGTSTATRCHQWQYRHRHVAGQPCMFIANDATVKGGSFFHETVKKHRRAQEIAWRLRRRCSTWWTAAAPSCPSRTAVPDRDHFGNNFFQQCRMSQDGIPQISAVFGGCTAGGAYPLCPTR